MNKKIVFILFICWIMPVNAEVPLIDSAKNIIQNVESLTAFYQKLAEAKKGNGDINILHIGDSHIQAGFLTGTLRRAFQNDYGNAGRGLVFPYRLANTNGDMDVRFSSSVSWQRYRIITEEAPKVGISGATVYTNAKEFFVKLQAGEDEAFNQIEIFGEGLSQVKLAIADESIKIQPKTTKIIHKVKSGDVLGKIARKYHVTVSQIKHWNHLRGTMIRIGQKLVILKQGKTPVYDSSQFEWVTVYEQSDNTIKAVLPEATRGIYLIKEKQDVNKTVSLYSLHLSNSQQGVVYNAVGYNGAKYTDYLKSPLFFTQMEELFRPDLVIISLGTNEAFDKVYSLESFRNDVELFCKEIELRTGCHTILFTTPPSALVSRRYPNKKLLKYAEVLKEVAQERNYAVWDLYEIMGGEQGLKKWYKSGLAGKDRIHFKEEGYRLQGESLYKALTKHAE
ncbi:LysM domain-containing protein [Balneicella halophila]|uniref:LysM domain-containing protein n=1 Tax=Balneicella halophila TaxID=1537566 RepID=A0A7L4USG5_BALHA|nr:LysM peptidoglycan-binding domain-containing protein [Balneicella halophila]PVX52639.1 LysM domain-containing protein [Balneicella halophila]